jgi:multiple antibiotic resistance protein
MDASLLLTSFVTLFVMIDPIGIVPVFVAVTQGMSPAERRRVSARAIAVAFGLLTLFGLAGESLLTGIGVSMPAFRISGGLLLFLTALDMLFERRTERRGRQGEVQRDDPSVFPLATPMLAGPGALATMILLVGQQQGDVAAIATIHAVMAALLGLAALFFSLAGVIARALGPTGILVVTRLLGILLAALSVQFVLDGLDDVGLIGG